MGPNNAFGNFPANGDTQTANVPYLSWDGELVRLVWCNPHIVAPYTGPAAELGVSVPRLLEQSVEVEPAGESPETEEITVDERLSHDVARGDTQSIPGLLTLARRLVAAHPGSIFSVSYTTRAPRPTPRR